MSGSAPDQHKTRPARGPWLRVGVEVLVVLVVFACVGALAGWVWFRVWDPPVGTVVEGQWFTDEAGLRDTFAGTGWYVVIALACALPLGALATLVFRRAALVTLAAVAAGSILAAWLMVTVGVSMSPPDPDVAARTADEETRLPGDLTVAGRSPYLAWPVGALVGLCGVNLLTSGMAEMRRRDTTDPQWLSRNPGG